MLELPSISRLVASRTRSFDMGGAWNVDVRGYQIYSWRGRGPGRPGATP